ncbi:unnamed protein product [Brassica napus]|uniref:(rape) hypothetical protein n=1 Tax=Brassica napus TaxID=3708 RepID=A0A816LSH8_BRANA|nr:unnamed protein product [Brassica napus]
MNNNLDLDLNLNPPSAPSNPLLHPLQGVNLTLMLP